MRSAVVKDFVATGLSVATMLDQRIVTAEESDIEVIPAGRDLEKTFLRAITEFDFVLVIAPECDGILQRCSQWLGGFDQKRLFPNHKFIELCSNKTATLDLMGKKGVTTPATVGAAVNRQVIKPNFGCGSEGIRVVDAGFDISDYLDSAEWLVEPFVEGVPASVSVIGGGQPLILHPLRQVFDREPIGSFVEAVNDLSDRQIELARDAAAKVCQALPTTNGYFGIDMVVDDQRATVIEVNPRLTDSYSTLRKIHDFNLAGKMIELLDYSA